MKMTEEGARERAVQAVGIHRTDHTINCITNAILTACAAESEASAAQLGTFQDWLLAKIKSLPDYKPPTDQRDKEHEIYGWMHVLCAHYEWLTQREEQLASVTKERDGAKYIPGQWRCLMCGFQLSSNVLYVAQGTVAPNTKQPEPCPNDGQTMVPVTWEERCNEHGDRVLEEISRNRELATQLSEANRKLADIAKDREQVAVAAVERAMEHGLCYDDEMCSCGWVPDENGRSDLAKLLEQWKDHIRSLGPPLALDEMLAKARLEEAEIWHKEYVTNPDSYWTCQTPSERIAALRVRAKAKEVDRG